MGAQSINRESKTSANSHQDSLLPGTSHVVAHHWNRRDTSEDNLFQGPSATEVTKAPTVVAERSVDQEEIHFGGQNAAQIADHSVTIAPTVANPTSQRVWLVCRTYL